MNQSQKDMLAYMQEVILQEDEYVAEAWSMLERFVLDALVEQDDCK